MTEHKALPVLPVLLVQMELMVMMEHKVLLVLLVPQALME